MMTQSETYSSRPLRVSRPSPRSPVTMAVTFFSLIQAKNVTAIEAQRTGLQVIREAVGENVQLDKDGSAMLAPVGYVDEGRISTDTGHGFEPRAGLMGRA